MANADALGREIGMLRERMSKLNTAILRISTSLELDTVLSEVVESARALTGARYGAITTAAPSGELQDVVTSGVSRADRAQMMAWSGGVQLFEHFCDLPGPVGGRDLACYVRSLGLAGFKWSMSFHVTPMRHRGLQVGTFFMGGKRGEQEFTSEDEEILVLFAAQAATAVANALTHRDERRARAGLEALIDASPLGVAVFDGATGSLRSLNREGKRIVGSLRVKGGSFEELSAVTTCRFADGREVTLDELKNAETQRAEEVVLSVPDGRSVTVLLLRNTA